MVEPGNVVDIIQEPYYKVSYTDSMVDFQYNGKTLWFESENETLNFLEKNLPMFSGINVRVTPICDITGMMSLEEYMTAIQETTT